MNALARTCYNEAVAALQEYCIDNTDVEPSIFNEAYPICVQFTPKPTQMSLFDGENVDENGEVNKLTVTIGITTTVHSTLKFNMEASIFKRLIKMAEQVGHFYYQAFMETRIQADTYVKQVDEDYEQETT